MNVFLKRLVCHLRIAKCLYSLEEYGLLFTADIKFINQCSLSVMIEVDTFIVRNNSWYTCF